MLKRYLRAIYSDNGTLTDISLKVQANGIGHVSPLTASEDYLYIGQYSPFNNFFLYVGTENTVTNAALTVEYWDGTQWRQGVDLVDGTNQLRNHGVIQFSPNIDHQWERVLDTSDENDGPEELQDLVIYDLYWLRIKSSVTLKTTTKISRIGYAFCLSEDLKTHLPDIDSFISVWSCNKSDWFPEIMEASEQIVTELKVKGIIKHGAQLLRFDEISLPTQLQTILNITNPAIAGDRFAVARDEWFRMKKEALSIKGFTVDQNKSATVEVAELGTKIGKLTR